MYYYLMTLGYLVDQRRETARKVTWEWVEHLMEEEASVGCWISVVKIHNEEAEAKILAEVEEFQRYMRGGKEV